jgi:hypothetical protein
MAVTGVSRRADVAARSTGPTSFSKWQQMAAALIAVAALVLVSSAMLLSTRGVTVRPRGGGVMFPTAQLPPQITQRESPSSRVIGPPKSIRTPKSRSSGDQPSTRAALVDLSDDTRTTRVPKPRKLEPLRWTARGLYLPSSNAAVEGFLKYEDKQRHRDATLLESWKTGFPVEQCLKEVPECEFFRAIGLTLLLAKCCAEHMKLKAAFLYAMDVADEAGLQLFLDSGTLLSAIRDGQSTLVPWETDIDLGIVGVEPALVAKPFTEAARLKRKGRLLQRRHYFAPCLTKVSKNVSRHGMCRDAHYVFYAESEEESQHDTSRVEIWPFWPEPGVLVHPTRKKLSVDPALVLPLTRCRFWGRDCWCPRDSVGYLNHEYGADGSWRRPKTIHWGKDNVQSLTGPTTAAVHPQIATKKKRKAQADADANQN